MAPSPLYLNAIKKEAVEPLSKYFNFKEDEPKYILNLKTFKDHECWLKTLKKNDRRDLRKDRNRILKQNPEILIDNFSDFEKLVELAKERFAKKGEIADWEDEKRVKTFKEVINLSGKSYKARMISVKINGKYAGVDLNCIFKDSY
ncbi:hypothetical protein H5T58_00440 [Candidatus Parcubacteria bacterium]|nr:hypothetical protein [Candidatus Parcubacteria bacterium]